MHRNDFFQASEYYPGYKNHDPGYVHYPGNSYYQGNKHNPGYDL